MCYERCITVKLETTKRMRMDIKQFNTFLSADLLFMRVRRLRRKAKSR